MDILVGGSGWNLLTVHSWLKIGLWTEQKKMMKNKGIFCECALSMMNIGHILYQFLSPSVIIYWWNLLNIIKSTCKIIVWMNEVFVILILSFYCYRFVG